MSSTPIPSGTSIFLRAVGQVSSLLSHAMAPHTTVYQRRARGLPQGIKSCVVVRVPVAKASTGAGRGVPSVWGTHLQVDCMVRASTDADASADALMGAVIEALKPEAVQGTPVAGMELAQVDWDDDYDGESSVCVSISYRLQHAGPFGGGVRL